MLPLCVEYGVDIIVNTDSHDADQVGDFVLAQTMLERLGIPDDRILNNDTQKLKAFLLG
jgi:putative hydrolase